MSLHAVILAGGSGTRFWPLSRAKKPKQFLALVTERTLIAETFARVAPLCPSERTWVVCGKDHVEGVRAALPDLPAAHLIVEPVARNTAPAIGLACVHALRDLFAATADSATSGKAAEALRRFTRDGLAPPPQKRGSRSSGTSAARGLPLKRQ